MDFKWDPEKARRNVRKHGVSFSEAKTVFADPLAVIFDDEGHSAQEPREIIVGHSEAGRLLVVAFVERDTGVRVISARLATPRERRKHEQHTSS